MCVGQLLAKEKQVGVEFFDCDLCGDTICDAGSWFACDDCNHVMCEECEFKHSNEDGEVACPFCSKEEATDSDLLEFALLKLGMTRHGLLKEYQETEDGDVEV
jgi:Zinc finger, C3HC4 type (RING finger)